MLSPAGDVQDHAVARHIVLNADVEVIAPSIKKPARPFRVQVIDRADLHTAIGQEVVVISIIDAGPEVVVATDLWTIAVFVNDPAATARLVGEVVHHREVGGADDQVLDLW